jgi:hypothetical protein
MTNKRDFTRIAGVVIAVAFAQSLVAAPALAEQEAAADCVCVVAGGTVGTVTGATGWVKLNGDVGLVDATTNAPLSVGSVLQTGVAGSASATVGPDCNVNVASLTKMSISPMADGNMCVRLTSDAPTAPVVDGGGAIGSLAVAGGAAVLAGTLVVVGLGQEAPVSQ